MDKMSWEEVNEIKYEKPFAFEGFFNLDWAVRFANYNNAYQNGRILEFSCKETTDYFIIYAAEGPVTVENGNGRYELNAGNMFIWQPSGKQKIISYVKGGFVIFISSGYGAGKLFEKYGFECDKVYKYSSFRVKNNVFFNKQVEYIIQEAHGDLKNHNTVASAMLIEFLGIYSRNLIVDENAEEMELISWIVGAIKENAAHDIDIRELIKSTHMSKSKFYTIFKRYMGMSIHQYINDYRLSICADYLSIYDYPIARVAEIMGFSDPLYFSRLFKKKYGVSPSKYREQYKGHNFIHNVENG